MSHAITQRELRNDSGKVLRAVEAGESFIITRNGTPVAEIIPLRPRRSMPVHEVVAMFAPLREDYDKYRAQMDAFLDPSLPDRYGDEPRDA